MSSLCADACITGGTTREVLNKVLFLKKNKKRSNTTLHQMQMRYEKYVEISHIRELDYLTMNYRFDEITFQLQDFQVAAHL